MFLSIIPFIKKKSIFLSHVSILSFAWNDVIKNRIPINRIDKMDKTTFEKKNIYIYLFDYHIFNWSILSYFPPIFKRYKKRGREWKKSAIINMHRHEDKHLPALKNIPVATRHAQTPASKSRMHARPYICT